MTTELKTLTATQARSLVESSEEMFNRRFNLIFAAIEKAALLAKNEIVLDWAIHNVPEFTIDIPPYSSPQLTPIQQVISAKLKSLGYTVETFQHVSEPRGLGCIEDDPQPVKSYHIRVRW